MHLDFWRPQRARTWFGWIPEELCWRLAWMGLAFCYLVWFCGRVWREEDVLDAGERDVHYGRVFGLVVVVATFLLWRVAGYRDGVTSNFTDADSILFD